MTEADSNQHNLAGRKCTPCSGGAEPLKGSALHDFFKQLGGDWDLVEEHHLESQYRFKDFKDALNFVNEVGRMAEQLGHHPDIYLAWGKVRLQLWTHKIKGLHENDFIFAAKADRLYEPPDK